MIVSEDADAPQQTLCGDKYDLSSGAVCGLLALLMAVGFILRTYGLNSLSITFDEYVTAFYPIGVTSTRTYVDAIQNTTTEYVAGYLWLQHRWLSLLGSSILLLRLFPVAINCAAIPLMYAVATRLFGRKAALLAATFLALSPMCSWWSQGIRPYAFAIPITLVSLYTFMRAYNARSPLWALANVAVDFFMVFALLPTLASLTAFQMLFLVPRLKCTKELVWGVAKGLAPVTFVIALAARHYFNVITFSASSSWSVALWACLRPCLTGLDSLFFNTDIPQPARILSVSSPIVIANVLLATITACSVLWLGIKTLQSGAHRGSSPDRTGASTVSRYAPLFLAMAIAIPPALTAIAVTAIQRGVIFPRYSMQILPAIYATMGAFLMAVRPKTVRRMLCVLVIVLYLCQMPTFLRIAQRANWHECINTIHREESSDDLVVVAGEFYSGETLTINAQLSRTPLTSLLAAAPTLQAAVDATVSFLARNDPCAQGGQRCVWLACQRGEDTGIRADELEAGLRSLGFTLQSWVYSGGDTLLLYRVNRPERTSQEAFPDVSAATPVSLNEWNVREPGALLDELEGQGVVVAPEERALWEGRLRRIGFFALSDVWDVCIAGMLATAAGDNRMGAAIARNLIQKSPRLAVAHVVLAAALENLGNREEARNALSDASRKNPVLASYVGPAFQSVWNGKDGATARRDVLALRAWNSIFALPIVAAYYQRFEQGIRLLPAGVYATRVDDIPRLSKALWQEPTYIEGLNATARTHLDYVTRLWAFDEHAAISK